MENARNKKIKQRFEFLYPISLIKSKKFSSRDVRNIKDNITSNMTIIRIVVALLIFAVSLTMMISMGKETNWNIVSKYGTTAFAAQIISMCGCFACIIMFIISLVSKKERFGSIINRIASDLLYSVLSLQMFLGIYADAEMGFTISQEALSASIVFIAILVLIQPSYWLDVIILDLLITATMIGLSLYCESRFGMKAVHYYILVSVVFPLASYFVVTLLFYAECQHYKDILENERLTDKAYYDHLTQCKNRHALAGYIKENSKRWENKDNVNLLIILFDVDNFKQYNDQFSHLGGDYCLKSIAEAIRRAFPSPSLDFFRYGGEEFLLFFELNNPDDAAEVMEQTREAIKNMELEAPRGAPKDVVTISVGGLLIRNVHSFSFENEMQLVDKYLYTAKANGKDVSCLNGILIEQ